MAGLLLNKIMCVRAFNLCLFYFSVLLGRLLLIRSNHVRSPTAVTIYKFYRQIKPEFNISEQKRMKYSLFTDSIKIIISRSLENSFVSQEKHLALMARKWLKHHPTQSHMFLNFLTVFRLYLVNNSPTDYGLCVWNTHKKLSGSVSPTIQR